MINRVWSAINVWVTSFKNWLFPAKIVEKPKVEERVYTIYKNWRRICKLSMPVNVSEEDIKEILFNSWRYQPYFEKHGFLSITIKDDKVNISYEKIKRQLKPHVYSDVDRKEIDNYIENGDIDIPKTTAYLEKNFPKLTSTESMINLSHDITFVCDTHTPYKLKKSTYKLEYVKYKFNNVVGMQFITLSDNEIEDI